MCLTFLGVVVVLFRGVSHPHAQVRQRSSYLLIRLVKEVAGHEALFRPLVEPLVAAAQVGLENLGDPLFFDSSRLRGSAARVMPGTPLPICPFAHA
jgi:hypothetical protein